MAKKNNITEVGRLNYKDLQAINDEHQGIAQETTEIPEIQNPFAAGAATYYQGNMTTPQRRQSGAGTTPFGESFWDPEGMVGDYQLEHLENLRAQNQSGLAQAGNGLLKMTTTALTTLADGTIGALYGLIQGGANLIDGNEKTGFWEGMWNNDFNKAMSYVQEQMEEIAPNYYTDEQRNSPWYSAANVLSANFLGDKLLKNAGFTIGALASLAVPGFDMGWLANLTSKGAKALGIGAKASENAGAIANYLARTFVSANSEASIEAINAVKDNQKSMYEGIQQRANEDYRASEMMMQQEIASGVDEQTAQRNHMARLQNIDQEVANAKAFADEQLRDVGNSVWLMNTGLLSITNSLEFSNILKGGYNLRKSLKDFGVKLTAEGKEVGAREFGRALARGVETSMTPNFPSVSAMGIVGGTAKRFGSEGFEEGAQRMISDSNEMQAQAKLQQWADDRYNQDSNKYSLWEKQINPTVTADLVDYTKALTKAWSEGFGTLASSGWEEVFLGGLTGMFGTAGIRQKADGKMGIGWQGGIYESIKDQQARYTEADKMIQAFNDQLSKSEFKQRMQHSAAALASAYDMEESLNNGDIMGYKNAEMLSIVNDAIYFRDNGMLDLFKGYYEETAQNVSNDTINDLRSQTKDVKTGKSFYDGKSNDEIRQMIQDKSKSTLEKIDNTIRTYEDMERQYSDKFREVDITPFIDDIKDPVVRANVALSGADYTQRGVQQLTYLSSLHDDLVRRRGELEQERADVESSIDGTDRVKQIDKDIAEIDEALTDIKNQFNKAKNNPSEMVQEMIAAQVRSAKVAIGQEEQATKARYHNAQSLQDVADTFMYGNYNQSVLEDAIHEATDEENKKLLESFYPFSAEVNATEGAINKVIENNAADEDDEVKNRAKAALGTFAQEAINETLSERADTGNSTTVADKLREYGKTVVEQADKEDPQDMLGAESTAAYLEEIAEELDKARTTAKVPEVKPAEEKKATKKEEEKPTPEAGKKGEPQDAAAQPEPAKKPEVKPKTEPETKEGEEVEIKPVEQPEKPTPTSKYNVGDKVIYQGIPATVTSIPANGAIEVKFDTTGKTSIIGDSDENLTPANSQSPTGGNSQAQEVTPNREREEGTVGNPVAAEYLLEGNPNTIQSAGYLFNALAGAFEKVGKEIEVIKAKYMPEIDKQGIGDMSKFVGSDVYNKAMAEIRQAIVDKYGEDGGKAFDKVMQSPTGHYAKEGLTALIDVLNVEATQREENAEQNKENQAGTSEQETRVVEPDTPEQEDKKEEARASKSFTGTNFLTYSQTILGRKNPADKGVAKRRKSPSLQAFQDLLTSKGIDIDHVVNNYMYDFMVDGKLPVRYMVMKDDEGKAVPSEGSEHIFLVTPITDKIQEFIEKDAVLQGNVKQMSDGSKMLVVGILGYGQNDKYLADKAEQIREAYRNMDADSKAKEYTIINIPFNSIYAMNGGQMVLQFEGQERGDSDLKTLLESDDRQVNPRKLSIGDIRFATAIGKEGEIKLKFFQKREGDDQYGFMNPLSLQGSPGNVWMFIRSADGKFIPTPVAPTTWNDNNMNWDSELGRKIRSLVDSLATVTNKEDIPALLKELNQRLVFSINNRNMGNRLFYDDKTGELSFRKFNLDAASDNAKIVLGNEESPFLVVDKSESLTLNLLNPERPMEESKQILYKMIEQLDPVINIQNSVMGSAGGIKMYLDAGLFKVAIKSLGVVNAKTYMYPVNDHLEPIDGFVQAPTVPITSGNVSTFYYNGERYAFSGEKLYDSNFNEITDSDIIQDIRAAADIQAGKVRPVRVNNTSYWEINGKVYSQYRAGGFAPLSPSEEVEYRHRKAVEAEKKQKERAAREEAAKIENQKTTQAKYKVGDDLNGRKITEVNIVDNEVVYTFEDAQNGIQNGSISQTELDNLLSIEAQNKAANNTGKVQQGSDDSQKGVKKTEQEPKTLAEKVSNSRNNTTFASVFKGDGGRTRFNDLVSAINSARERAGEESKQFKGTKALEEELVSRGKSLPTTVSELQALVEELNSCGF